MITITTAAQAKIESMLAEENNPNLVLRTFVQGGGCSGFQYGFAFDEEHAEDDFEFVLGTVRVVVDPMSMQYLQSAVIDYREDIMGAGFSINNPNATTTCGCGSSFGV